MAKFILGAVITNIAGSVGGTTFRRVKNGFSMMNKIKGASTSSLLQNQRVPQIANIFQRWAVITEEERAGWNATALTVTFPDKFGVPKNLTGRELFNKANIQLLPAGFQVSDSTGFTTEIPEFTFDSMIIDADEGNYSLTVSGSAEVATFFISVELSNKQIYQPTFKSRKVIQIGSASEPSDVTNIETALLANFPYISSGMWIAVYIQAFNAFGMLSPYQYKITQVA